MNTLAQVYPTATVAETDLKNLLHETNFNLPKPGDVVEGRVLALGRNEVTLDIGGHLSGIVRGPELVDESGVVSGLKVGDVVPATVLDLDNERGALELSFRAAGHHRAWANVQELFKNRTNTQARITEANRGGLLARVGNLSGFLPVSQLIPDHYPRVEGGDKNKILEKLKSFVGSDLAVRIIDVNEKEGKLIVSERAVHEEEELARLANFHVGDVVKGKVTGVVDFGAFVEFGEGVEGLVHISELSHERIEHPQVVVKVGEEIEVKIIGLERNRISLSRKALSPDPWVELTGDFKVGLEVTGKITKINPFGLFVELAAGVQGLAHISELALTPGQKLEDVFKVGETLSFTIISLDSQNHRLGLSRKPPVQTSRETFTNEAVTA